MERLILIRHAQSEQMVRGLTGGWTDTPLTPLGHEQANRLAVRCRDLFAEGPPPRLYASDLIRAAQTAEAVAAALGVTVRSEPALREINNGVAAGLTLEEAKAHALPTTEPAIDWTPYPEAETWRQMTERIFSGMERIASDAPGTAVVITQSASSIAVIHWWLRLGECCRYGVSFDLDPASITVLGVNESGERTLFRFNDTEHLRHP